ncbi:GNAT family N-acetyltransferase [Jeotgalibacillus malaysiensis]|uniref:GNAT family N-acetyltransferase n=1 Tax=Jeotgalibacillus malaysiensis TaxID=1508404 RepID=UPI00384C9AFE
MKELSIQKVSADNWRSLAGLTVAADQNPYIEPNEISMLESFYDTKHNWVCFGLFKQDQPLGFMMIGAENKEEQYIWLDRFMIDQGFQGSGLGKSFIQLAIEYIFAHYAVNEIVISIKPENVGAKRFYTQAGFEDSGLIDPKFDEDIFVYERSTAE